MDDKTRQATKGFNATGVDFILTELDTAMTFCDSALASRDVDHAVRSTQQAKRVLDSAMHFKERVKINDADQKKITERTSRVQSLLKELADRNNSSHDRP